MGNSPCPRCLITKDLIPQMGSVLDQNRRLIRRVDDEGRQRKVQAARKLIYVDGRVVNSEAVESILRSESLVPTIV